MSKTRPKCMDKCSVLGVQEVASEDVSKYGIVSGVQIGDRLSQCGGL